MKCPQCQQQNPTGQKFCGECGTPFKRPEHGTPPASYADLQHSLTEALEQQAATTEILQVISSSPAEVQPVLNAVSRAAARLCGASDVVIRRVDGAMLRLWAHHGSIPLPASEESFPLTAQRAIGRAIIERRTIHLHDIAELQSRGEYPDARSVAQAVGYRTLLVAPLVRQGVSIGAILIRRMEMQPFSDQQVKLLEIFADQAVIAIENVRLFTELQEKNRALTKAHAQVTEALEYATAQPLGGLREAPSPKSGERLVSHALVRDRMRVAAGSGAYGGARDAGFTPDHAWPTVRRETP